MSKNNKSGSLLFERKPSGIAWVITALITVVLLGVAGYYLYHTHTAKNLWLPAIFASLALLSGLLTFTTFRVRNRLVRFFDDRVDVYEKGEVARSIPYTDVEWVSYGFRGEAEHRLQFEAGPGNYFEEGTFTNDTGNEEPTKITIAKLLVLRDLLYGFVANRMLRKLESEGKTSWVKGIEITSQGLIVAGRPLAWDQCWLKANDNTGALTIMAGDKALTMRSMVDRNAIPGLQIVEHLSGNRAVPVGSK